MKLELKAMVAFMQVIYCILRAFYGRKKDIIGGR